MKLIGAGVLPLKTPNPLNEREHHFARARRAKRQRKAAQLGALVAIPPKVPLVKVTRFVVELTRVAPPRAKLLDHHDALPASLKHLVDGICDRLGVDDGETERIRFVYLPQERGDWAVRFRVLEDDARPDWRPPP